jgi:hypothetical protein
VTSSAPPPPSLRYRALRPWYFMAVMVFVWLIGVQGLTDAITTLLYLHDGNVPDIDAMTRALTESDQPFKALGFLEDSARLRALGEAMHLAFPLYAAKLVLSVLLVLSSGMAMSGRPGARGLALQALLANAALAVTSFMLLRGARFAWIDSISRIADILPQLPGVTPPEQGLWTWVLDRRTLLMLSRIRLIAIDVGVLGLAAFILTRARTKAFFEAARRAAEQAEEP